MKNNWRNLENSSHNVLSHVIEKDLNGGYIALSGAVDPNPIYEEQIKEKGIGVIKFGKEYDQLAILHPPDNPTNLIYKNLIPESTKNTIDEAPNREELIKAYGKTFIEIQKKEKIKEFPTEIIIYVIIAGILGSSLWTIIEYGLGIISLNSNQLFIIISVSILLISFLIIYYYKVKKKIKKFTLF